MGAINAVNRTRETKSCVVCAPLERYVDRHVDRHLDCEFGVRVDGIEMCVEFVYVFSFYANMAVIYVSEPPFGRVRG